MSKQDAGYLFTQRQYTCEIMDETPNILWLTEIRNTDIPSVGGKGASLGEMTHVGLPVPQAFVVTAQAFRRFLQLTNLEDSIFSILEAIDVDDNDVLNATSDKVKAMVETADMPEVIRKEIVEAYKKMGGDIVVAVRSSATAEDLPDASFAGQQDTYLNILGEEDVIDAVQRCWASLYTARAIYYRAKNGFDDRSVNIAVVVQQLVFSEKAGVMFSSHPVSGAKTVIIEGSWGLGEAIVSGTVSPDNYVYDRQTHKVVNKTVAIKSVEIIPDGNKGTKISEVPADRQTAQVLTDEEIAALAEFAVKSEEHYENPQDMEWGMVGDKIYILQSRPITTIQKGKGASSASASTDAKHILQGYGASPGIATGKVVIVNDARETSKVQEGDIMVSTMTNPDMVPAMKKVAGIITDEGGMTCHAAIVSRELGTPAVVGTKQATALLKEGQIVTIDGEKGLIYDGAVTKIEEVRWYFTIILLSSFVIFTDLMQFYPSFGDAVRDSFFQVASIITTTGFATADFNLWSATSKSTLVLLMFVGACAGSTGGGLKVSRLIILIKTIFKELTSYTHPKSIVKIKMDDKPIEHEVVRSANVYFITYMIIFVISVFCLTFDNKDLVTIFTAVASTFNNIGPGLELVGPTANFGHFSDFSKLVMIFDMLAGRLELFPLLMLFHPELWRDTLKKRLK